MAGLSACGTDATTPQPPGPAAHLLIVSGNDQAGVVGTQLPGGVVLRVTDAQDRPIPGQLLNFRVTQGGGSVFAGSSLTDANGIGREIWTLGTVAGTAQELQVRAVDNSTGAPIIFATFSASVRAGPASRLVTAAGDSQYVLLGQPLLVLPGARLSDSFGNPRIGDVVSFAISAGGGSVAGAQAVTDANGIATVGSWQFDDTPTHTLSAASGALTPVIFSAWRSGLALDAVAHTGSVICGLSGPRRYCAGLSNYGAYGNGSQVNSSVVFTEASSLNGLTFARMQGGSNGFCGVSTGAVAYCWGSDNQLGELGDGTLGVARIVPTRVALPDGMTVSMVSVGGNNGCALTATISVYCWGDASGGRIGDGLPGDAVSNGNYVRPTPRLVSLPAGKAFTVISTYGGTCGVESAGVTYCWGAYAGDGGDSIPATPTRTSVPPGVAFDSVAVGGGFVCALSRSGDVYCWGSNNWGQVAIESGGTRMLTPHLVARQGTAQYVAVGAGSGHVCALIASGAVYCWGDNDLGQLGDGKLVRSTFAPQRVPLPAGLTFVGLSVGENTACARTSARATFCWGHNATGELGNGTTTTSTPSLVTLP